MAHHFNESSIEFLKNLPRITSNLGYRPTSITNGWHRTSVIRSSGTREGYFPYHDVYRTPTEELTHFPMYNLTQGFSTIYPMSSVEAGYSVDGQSLVRSMYRSRQGRDINSSHISATVAQIFREISGLTMDNYALFNAISAMHARFRGLVEVDVPTCIQAIDEIVEASLDMPMMYYTLVSKSVLKGTYYDVHSALGTYHHNGLKVCSFKAGNVASGFGTLVDLDRGIILGMLTVKAEFLQYYNLCRFHKQEMNMEIFTLLVDEKFTKNEREYATELYKVFKKGVQDILPAQIEVEYVNGEELFPTYFGDKYDFEGSCLGPVEQIEQNAIIQDEMLAARASDLNLRRGGARITM